MPTAAEVISIAAAQKMVQGIVNQRLIYQHFGPPLALDGEGDAETATSWTLFADARFSSPGSGMCTFRRGQTFTDQAIIRNLRTSGADIRPNRV